MADDALVRTLLRCYQALLETYGPQHWWPGDGPFEIMVGAVLVQNTAWPNVERAIGNLKAAGVLSPSGLRGLRREELERLIRPAGTYRVKAGLLLALVDYLWQAHGGDPTALARGDPDALRRELLGVPGIGPETADDILLYAGGHPTFVVDAFTRRVISRLGLASEEASYEELRALFMDHLPADATLFNEYHALLVRHAKVRCRARVPCCPGCPLGTWCTFHRGRDSATSPAEG